ncbi:unnamed protein product [Paramecium primaurelia]|uniref:Transmembrane protein n=1 Tax=Paramecium primaurelia TaxID=5886 RepID=A0A8S1K3D2_PARPR|nr:unnamed protein product [Paramecium primaurelia]
MSHSSSRIVVQMLTLNSLLQIYENQPFEFNDSNLMMQHPQLTSIIPTNQLINLTVGILILFLIDWKNKLNIITSLFFGLSVIMQNFKQINNQCSYLLPKTLNIIQIYLQLLIIIKYIYFQTKKIYFSIKSLENNYKPTITISNKLHSKKKITKIPKKVEKQKQKQENTITNEIQAKIVQQQMNIEQTQIKDVQIQEQSNQLIQEQHISEAELETENQCEINHSDLSQISSIKEEQKLQIQLKFNGKNEQFCCTFDTFETISQILSSSFTDKQIIQIKIHILLNFYDENQDGSCRLWCIKKLLAFQF